MKITVASHVLAHAVAALRRAVGRGPLLLIARDSELLIVVLGGRASCRVTVPTAAPASSGVVLCELATLDALAALDGDVELQLVVRDARPQLYAFQGETCRLAVPAPQPERTWSFDDVARAPMRRAGCSRTLARGLQLARSFASAKASDPELHVVRLVQSPNERATIFATDNRVRFALTSAALDDVGPFAVPASLVPALTRFLRRCRAVGVHDGPGNTYLRSADGPAYLFGWERPRLCPPSPSERRAPGFAARLDGGALRQYLTALRHQLAGGASRVAVELAFGTDVLRIRAFDRARPLGFDTAIPFIRAEGGRPQTVTAAIETLRQVTDGVAKEVSVSITDFGRASLLDFAEQIAITNDGRVRPVTSAPSEATRATIRRGARVAALGGR